MFTSDPEVLKMSPMFMLALVVSLPGTSMMCPYQAFIEGIGNATLVMIIALLDGFVSRIVISLLLAEVFNLGLMGWFLGYGLAAYVNTILCIIYYYNEYGKREAPCCLTSNRMDFKYV
jgi:Na+-driven multidrug efflux pump